MARIRTIKPEFPQSETVGKLSRDARLLFIQLWTIVDDAGRTRAASRMLASLLYPYDDDARDLIEGWLTELEREGAIRRYEVDGSNYLEISNWLEHQKIDHPSKSRLPEFREDFSNPREDSRTLAPDLGPRTKDLSCTVAKATRTKEKYSEEFERDFWRPYPRTPTMAKKEAWREWLRLAPDQRLAACQAIEPYRKFLRSKPNLETVHACRFLSQERFEGFSDPQAAQVFDIRSHIA